MRVRRGFLQALTAIAIVLGGGYLSNWLSQGACRRHLAKRALEEMELANTRGVTIYALPGEVLSLQTLKAMGVPAKQCSFRESAGETFDCFPWVSVENIQALGPYVAQAEWGHVWGGTSGVMRRTTLLSFFGLVFSLSERDTIVS